MSEFFIGQIMMAGFSFAPKYFADFGTLQILRISGLSGFRNCMITPLRSIARNSQLMRWRDTPSSGAGASGCRLMPMRVPAVLVSPWLHARRMSSVSMLNSAIATNSRSTRQLSCHYQTSHSAG